MNTSAFCQGEIFPVNQGLDKKAFVNFQKYGLYPLSGNGKTYSGSRIQPRVKKAPDPGSETATLLKSHLMIQSLRVKGKQILSNQMQQKKNKFLNLALTLQGIPSKHWPA